jgi:hypothetical protein
MLGVALGVTLILLSLTALPALDGREQRLAWHRTSPSAAKTSPDRALWLPAGDHYVGRELFRVHVAALGAQPPVPPGLTRLPAPGEVAVSPALRHLIASTPVDQLATRFPGTITTTIGPEGVAYPGELVAIIGRSPDELRAAGAGEIAGIETRPGTYAVTGPLKVIFTIGVIGLLLPVIIFSATVTRIAAARREERFAALRLAGATRGQIAMMAATETAIAAVGGAVLGWLGYLAGRPVTARLVTFDGAHFIGSDVVAPTSQTLLVLVGVPLLATLTTIGSLYRVQLTPLGASRRRRRKPPRAWRLLPLGVGAVGLVIAATTDLTDTSKSSVAVAQLVIGGSFLSLLLGLVLAGPWVCMAAARMLSRLSRRAPSLMAARRMAADPHAIFRAISGVVIAVFVTTMFAGSAAGVTANYEHPDPAALRPGAVEVYLPGQPTDRVDRLAGRLGEVPGVRRLVTVRQTRAGALAVSCEDLAVAVNISCSGVPNLKGRAPLALQGATGLTAADPALPVRSLYLLTDGAQASEERVRSMAGAAFPGAVVSSYHDLTQLDSRQLRELSTALRAAMIFIVFVAACSLTIGVIAGLMERRRPFALLRASGVRLAELRRVVLLETTVPLGLTAVTGALIGLAASVAVTSSTGERWVAPGLDYAAAVLIGLLATVAVSSLTLPLIGAMTRHDSVRFD